MVQLWNKKAWQNLVVKQMLQLLTELQILPNPVQFLYCAWAIVPASQIHSMHYSLHCKT